MTETPIDPLLHDKLTQQATVAALRTLVLDSTVVASHNTAIEHEVAANAPPSIIEQSKVPDLPGEFTYAKQAEPKLAYFPDRDADLIPMSESEGLRDFRSFLEDFISLASGSDNGEDRALVAQAIDILHNTTYVGELQLDEGAATMATTWKRQLDEDPTKSIYLWATPGKSNMFVLDRVLGHFSEADIEKYRGQLHFLFDSSISWKNGREVSIELPANSEVVMAEDWVDSGRQFANEYSRIYPQLISGPYPVDVSLHLITASPELLGTGAYIKEAPGAVPVSARYTSRIAADGKPIHTGLHSSTDDRFEEPIGMMVASLRERHDLPDTMMPPMTNIMRPYHAPDYVPANVVRVAQAYGEQYPQIS